MGHRMMPYCSQVLLVSDRVYDGVCEPTNTIMLDLKIKNYRLADIIELSFGRGAKIQT